MYASGLGRDCLAHTLLWEDPPGRHPPPGQTPRVDTPPSRHPRADTPPGRHTPAQCMLGYTPLHSAFWDTVNKRAVRIRLECILFGLCHHSAKFIWGKNTDSSFFMEVTAAQILRCSQTFICVTIFFLGLPLHVITFTTAIYQTTGENPLQIEILKNIACLWKTRLRELYKKCS